MSNPESNKELRAATLLTCIGPDALDGFHFETPEQAKDIDVIMMGDVKDVLGPGNYQPPV